MSQRFTQSVRLALAAGTITGCAPETASTAMRLEGDMGRVSAFSSTELEVHPSNQNASVRIDVENTDAQWWVMTTLTFSPPLSDRAWAAGTTVATTRSTLGTAAVNVDVLGCSGPSHGNYTYDEHAVETTVHVEDGRAPGTRHVTFTSYFERPGESTQAVTGAFEFTPE